MLTLIRTARLNEVDPQAWLADVLARIPQDHRPRRATALELEAGKGQARRLNEPTDPGRSSPRPTPDG